MTSTHAPASAGDPGTDVPTRESHGARIARHGRRVRLYMWAGLLVAAFALLVVLVSANTHAVKLDWAVGSTHASLDWIILAAAVLGWLLGITTAVVFRHRTRRPR